MRHEPTSTVTDHATPGLFDRARFASAADWLAVAVVASLPWSTSATGILLVLWLLAVLPTLDLAAVRREVMKPAGGLPVLLWAFAALGMLWADVEWRERLAGLGGFHKLLLIPLLLAQFRRSGRAHWVVLGFVASSALLLVFSFALTLTPGLTWRGKTAVGVPIKDYIAQSGIFALCALGLLGQSTEFWRQHRVQHALMLAGAAALFVANILYVATGRTTLVVVAALLLLLGFRCFGGKGSIAVCLIGGTLAGITWVSSPYLRLRVTQVIQEVTDYRERGAQTSSGQRLEFWQRSAEFITQAPVLGHGTGSIETLFKQAVVAEPGSGALVTRNPHSQILTVAVQLGMAGAVLLIAMWLAHLALFTAATPMAWFGLIVVVQNIVGSMFNSHIGDFTQGWIYVVGVGVLGGAMRSDAQPRGGTT
jgi:O-antigen ligase